MSLDENTALLDRENSARLLCNVLLGSGGDVVTLVLDQCYGAGKTSLVWKFRKLAITTHNKNHPLFDATYLSVRFQENDFSPPKDCTDEQFKASAEEMICKKLVTVLGSSSQSSFPVSDNMTDLCRSLSGHAGSTKFLFHFDEIGCFETIHSEDVGRKTLYCVWSAAEKLRNMGHFFVLSGRSRHLHSIGKQFSQDLGPDFGSPNSTRLIPLDTLSSDAVKAVFESQGATSWIEKDGNLKAISLLTGGVPRAVYYAALYVKSNDAALATDERLRNHIETHCSMMFTLSDNALFRHLVEMSWAGIDIDVNTVAVDNEPISATLTRFGLYTSNGSEPNRRVIETPLYMSLSQSWMPGSLRSIAQYSEPGDRLETGFRRVLFLRLSVVDADKWAGLRLGYLDTAGVPFLSNVKTIDIYNFPKLVKSAAGDGTTAKEFMELAHECKSEENSPLYENRDQIQANRQVFSPTLLKELAQLMRIGDYYLPLPRSSSADAMVRIALNTKLDWQFKNFQSPITKRTMIEEAGLCKIEGWKVYLVIFCTAGHNANTDGSDFQFESNGVTVIALSRESVSDFIGHKLWSQIKSTGLMSDQATRLKACTSPLKKKYKCKATDK